MYNVFLWVCFLFFLALSHVHKCHGSTQCSQCYWSLLTKIFVKVKLDVLTVPLAERPPPVDLLPFMIVNTMVPGLITNELCICWFI